ncbi:MAG TPA: hypothetical protein VH328_12080, partial [Burkholderiaceae bacterium]|nr:hypothetical protein [Burkholderiaceae bacterium]
MTRRQAGLLGVALAAGVTGCGGDGALDPPVLVSPSQGDTTGSVWSDAALRPQFWWRAVDRASQYQVMVDDSCLMGTPCTFPSPEIDQMIAGTTFRPAAALPVSTTPPVGRRYFWHVRACAG